MNPLSRKKEGGRTISNSRGVGYLGWEGQRDQASQWTLNLVVSVLIEEAAA